ncbi:MAG: ATP-binding protein [Candidatus Helarchaeota archaeon]
MKLNPTFKRAISKFFSRFFEVSMLTILKWLEKITKIHFLYYTARGPFKNHFGGKVVPLNIAVHPEVQVSTSQDILEIVKRSGVFAIGKCYCRTSSYHDKNCKAPVETCILIADPQYIDEVEKQGYWAKVPYEKIEKTLKMADEYGLVHQLIYFPNSKLYYVICNCCSCCCAVISTYKKFRNTLPWFVIPSDFIAKIDDSLCKNCGTCILRCHFNALTKDQNNNIIFIAENCKGCGLCATKCPTGAIKLVKR